MSRAWSTCSLETHCGGCGNVIRVGHPMQTITPHASRSMKRKFVRCRLCAEGVPPDDLPQPQPAAPVKPTGQPSLPLQRVDH